MTATIHRLHHATELRIQAAHDNLIDVQQMRAEWSANRKAQEAAKVDVYQPLPRFGFAKRVACIAGFIVGLAIGHVTFAAMTAHIAHQMEDLQ